MTIITHGCRSNLAERDALLVLVPPGGTLINSCAVTAEAVRDARSTARAALREGPVAVTGCAATAYPDRFADLDVTIIPNQSKWQGASLDRYVRQSRGFVAIQDGCDHDCTFCVTRLARGPARSMSPERIVNAIQSLVDAGTSEVVLTGIDATSFGQDLEPRRTLGWLVQLILTEVDGLRRLRLSSLDSAEADPQLIECFSDKRLMPHLHLSLQSGHDLILKRMKRRHSRRDAVALIEKMKSSRPDVAITADLIAGFPTEDDEAHQASLSMLDVCDIVQAHVFPFSARPGTAAARMPQLPKELVRKRAAELRAHATHRRDVFLKRQIGQTVEIVSEGAVGITPHGFKVRLATEQPRGALTMVTPTRVLDGMLVE